MTAVAIKDGTELILDGHVYKVVGDPVESEVWLHCQALNKRLRKTIQDIYRMIERGYARIRPIVKADKDDVIKKIEKRCAVKFASLNDKDREEALRRKAYVRSIIDTNCSTLTKTRLDPLIGQTAKRISDPKPPSWVTLYRWYTIYTKSGGDIRSLVSHASRRGSRKPRLKDEVHDIIKEAIEEVYLTKYRSSIDAVVAAVRTRIDEFNQTKADQFTLPMPSEKTVRRAIKALDAYEVAVARYGRNAADRRFRGIGLGPRVSRPLERVEIDHTVLDLFIVDGETKRLYGRPTFTVMLDCYSRMVVGYYVGFEPPSVESVMHCLKQAIMPKDQLTERYDSVQGDWPCFGVPETIVVDNGREFLSRDFEFACEQAGISILNTPGRSPNFKGKVERFMRTLNTQCLTGLPGKVRAGKKIEGDFDPQKHAVMDIDEFEHHLMLWLVDIYSRQYHAGLKDRPIDVWRRGIKAFPHVSCPVSSDVFDFVFARRFNRSVSQKGIAWENLKFISDELIEWRARVHDGDDPKVEVRVNTSDLGIIQVVTSDGEVFDVPAEDMEYADGLRYQEHKMVCGFWNSLRSDSDEDVSLAAARVRLWEMAEKAKKGRKSVSLSKKEARLRDVGSNAGPTKKPKQVPTKVNATSLVELEGDWDIEDDDEDGAYVVVTGVVMLDSGQQERLRSLNSFIVKHPKMTRAIEAIEETKLLSYSAPEPQCLLIMGESGVGKTTLKNIFCDRYPREEKEDGTIVPVLSINIPAPATIGSMVSALLRNLGGPIVSSQSIDERTDRLRKLIVACGVELIILDEFQHFMEGNKKRISQGVSDWLKNLISETNVPIVLIGLPKSENILLADPQLKRRVTNKVNLETFRLGTSFQKFLKTLEGQLKMPEALGWAEKEMVRKFHNATQGNIAHLMNIVRAAAFEAIKQKADTISEEMLASAYEDRIANDSTYGAGGAPTNPFRKAEVVTKPRQPAKSRPRRTKYQRQQDEAKSRRDLSAALNPKGGA